MNTSSYSDLEHLCHSIPGFPHYPTWSTRETTSYLSNIYDHRTSRSCAGRYVANFTVKCSWNIGDDHCSLSIPTWMDGRIGEDRRPVKVWTRLRRSEKCDDATACRSHVSERMRARVGVSVGLTTINITLRCEILKTLPQGIWSAIWETPLSDEQMVTKDEMSQIDMSQLYYNEKFDISGGSTDEFHAKRVQLA